MSTVEILNVQVLNNPSAFSNPFQFEIEFICISPLQEDLEWKIIYVGCAEDSKHDQELDSVLVGPIAVGKHKFVFQADAPDVEKIPPGDVLGITIVMLQCFYRGEEFVRVGYYVNNEYTDEELVENPPEQVQIGRVTRSVLADEPRVTRFQIKWDEMEQEAAMAEPDTIMPSELEAPMVM